MLSVRSQLEVRLRQRLLHAGAVEGNRRLAGAGADHRCQGAAQGMAGDREIPHLQLADGVGGEGDRLRILARQRLARDIQIRGEISDIVRFGAAKGDDILAGALLEECRGEESRRQLLLRQAIPAAGRVGRCRLIDPQAQMGELGGGNHRLTSCNTAPFVAAPAPSRRGSLVSNPSYRLSRGHPAPACPGCWSGVESLRSVRARRRRCGHAAGSVGAADGSMGGN